LTTVRVRRAKQKGCQLRIAVGIATVGRPALLRAVLEELARQSRRPDHIVICAPTEADVQGVEADPTPEIVVGPRGLTIQRNAILGRLDDFDVVQFFDDDFLPSQGYLLAMEQAFAMDATIAMATGSVLADGIKGPGIDLDTARAILAADAAGKVGTAIEQVEDAYGCNMAVRLAASRASQCRFDERLPLYGWMEDVDFSRRLARHGRIVKLIGAKGIHLGAKQGRQSGVRLGYSQIANPIYLSRKGSCPWPRSLRLMGRNIAANLARSLIPEPYIDRAGRVSGNLKAFVDLIAGRLDPQRVLEL
jgi:GT2 family glycosyltransferase